MVTAGISRKFFLKKIVYPSVTLDIVHPRIQLVNREVHGQWLQEGEESKVKWKQLYFKVARSNIIRQLKIRR